MAAASKADIGGGKWRIRWREARPEGGWRSHEALVNGSEEDAEEYRLAVIRDLRATGHHDREAQRARYVPPANLIDGMLAHIDSQVADGLRASSAATYRAVVPLLAAAIHEVTRIRVTEPLPVTLLSRRLFDSLKPILAKKGETTPRAYLRVLWQAWGWLADDPTAWPHTPQRPSTTRGYVPPPKIYGRTTAPSIEHADACIRRLARRARTRDSVLCAVVMRYTGLRLRQALGIHREDLDLKAGTLLVRHGKSKQEQAEMRVIPLSRHLLAEALFVAAVEEHGTGPIVRATNPRTVMYASWAEASEHDSVPRYVWEPPNRINARPDHAFRAAFQAHLTSQRVQKDIVDFLVGHAGDLRDTHYGRELMMQAREAVDLLPPILWTSPPVADNVVTLHGGQGAH